MDQYETDLKKMTDVLPGDEFRGLAIICTLGPNGPTYETEDGVQLSTNTFTALQLSGRLHCDSGDTLFGDGPSQVYRVV